jgi:hypothetical protein
MSARGTGMGERFADFDVQQFWEPSEYALKE